MISCNLIGSINLKLKHRLGRKEATEQQMHLQGAGLLVLNGEPLRSFLSPCAIIYLLISMLDAIPLVWRNLLNDSKPLIAYMGGAVA